MKKLIFITIISLVLLSCDNKINSAIEGIWVIDILEYKNYDVKLCFYSNGLIFSNGGKMKLPQNGKRCPEILTNDFDESATWEISKSDNLHDTLPLKIKFNTRNKILSGTHHLVFHRDERYKLLKIEVWSDSLYMVCAKTLFHYDSNIEFIKELEKVSWTNR